MSRATSFDAYSSALGYNPNLYVFVVLDGTHLFIPQKDVETVEIIADLHPIRTEQGFIGRFGGHGQESYVFCLAEDLSLITDVPEDREYFFLLKPPADVQAAIQAGTADNTLLGVVCNEVETINFQKENLYPQPLPDIMKLPQSPISQLVIYHDKLTYICPGDTLWQYLTLQSAQFIAENEIKR
ncbi:hypothetical protein [Beggiatoa leptomitoformis]|uniref:CheW-like domain-containing protein n=1 Tax=Beggiatoa leptomitoformis TaxID=288004 RepID=A0A2N9YGM5_9GAMM|nr:hypothetical protein [Beggiatoa leptomitoformis]ALG67995.1 hypothetical protein AL038_10110 [Beggiatoa leptomitoformis]AUI69721.1 hypothetical protein BLE401_14170 [Beggiatoa leptomitoformis]